MKLKKATDAAPVLWYWVPQSAPENFLPFDHGPNPRKNVSVKHASTGSVGRGYTYTPGGGLAPRPESQQWIPRTVDGHECAIVLETPKRLQLPAELARAEQLPGHPVAFADGSTWHVPVVRMLSGGTGLPQRRTLAEDGTRGWAVLKEYQALSAAAERLWMHHAGEPPEPPVEDAEFDDAIAAALALNYHIGLEEIILLDLLDLDSWRRAAQALLDWPNVLKLLEKKDEGEATP